MARIYDTLAGHRIEYPDPRPDVDAFLTRVKALVEDLRKTENDLITLIYGRENPILERNSLFPDKGMVTREVLENPVYSVLMDLLQRKHLAETKVDPASLAKRYTLDIPTAAEKFGVTQAAIRKAIDEKRLPSWKKNGVHYLDPHTFHVLKKGKLAEATKGQPIQFRAGYDAKTKDMLRFRTEPGSFQVPTPGFDGELTPGIENSGTVVEWRRAIVVTGRGGSLRAWVLVPGDETNRVELGKFFVSGKFVVSEKANSSKAAREAWEAWEAWEA